MVEDEALILEIMAESLADAGYEVLTVSDGPTAMSLIETQSDSFSALFSDYHLPGGLTGLQIAWAMRSRHPALPVVLATGRPDVLDPRWRSDMGFVLMRKPYRPSELVTVMGGLILPHHAPSEGVIRTI